MPAPGSVILLCRYCGQTAPHTVKRNGAPRHWCTACQSTYSKAHYQANREAHLRRRIEYARRVNADRKALIRELKSRPCMDCGGTFPYYVMDFDHRDPREKKFTIASDYRSPGLGRLLEEIDKCDVVCANCHRIRTHKHLDEDPIGALNLSLARGT